MSEEQTATPEPTPEPAPEQAAAGKVFTQDDVERIVKDRLARQKAQNDAAQAKAAEEAKAATLKEQGEFRTLYEAEAAKVADLTGKAEAAARYEGALKKLLATQREGLPDHILPLLDSMDVAAQLEYLAEHGAKLRPTAATPATTTPPRGAPAGAKPATNRPTTPAPAGPTQPERSLIKF